MLKVEQASFTGSALSLYSEGCCKYHYYGSDFGQKLYKSMNLTECVLFYDNCQQGLAHAYNDIKVTVKLDMFTSRITWTGYSSVPKFCLSFSRALKFFLIEYYSSCVQKTAMRLYTLWSNLTVLST